MLDIKFFKGIVVLTLILMAYSFTIYAQNHPNLILQSGPKASSISSGFTNFTWSPNQKLIIAGTNENTAILYNAETGKIIDNLIPDGQEIPSPGLELYEQNYSIKQCLFSPDGQFIAVTSEIGYADPDTYIWSTSQRKVLAHRKGFPAGWLPDNRRILFGKGKYEGIIWDFVSDSIITQLKSYDTHEFIDIKMTPDKNYAIAYSSPNYVAGIDSGRLWNVQTGETIWKYPKGVERAILSNDSKRCFLLDTSKQLVVYNIQDRKIEQKLRLNKSSYAYELIPTNIPDAIIYENRQGKITVLNYMTGLIVSEIQAEYIAEIKNRKLIISSEAKFADNIGTAFIWDPVSNVKKKLGLQISKYRNFVLSPDSSKFFTERFWDNNRKQYISESELTDSWTKPLFLTGQICDANTDSLITTLVNINPNPVNDIYISKDEELLAETTGPNGLAWGNIPYETNTIRIWDLTIGKPISVIRNIANNVSYLDRDSFELIATRYDTIYRINYQSGKIEEKIDPAIFKKISEKENNSNAGDSIPVYDTKEIRPKFIKYLDPVPNQPDKTISFGMNKEVIPRFDISQLIESPDKKYYIGSATMWGSGGARWGAIFLWDYNTGRFIKSFSGSISPINCIAFSSDSKFLFCGEDYGMKVSMWDLKTGLKLRDFEGHKDNVNSITIFGNLLLSGAGGFRGDKNPRLWDINTGECLQVYKGSLDAISKVEFLKNGKFVIASSIDGSIRIWETGTGKQLLTVYSFKNGRWCAVTPGGYFDTNVKGEINEIAWVFPDDPFNSLSPEVFIRDYYESGLVKKIINGDSLPAIRPLEQLNRTQPGVLIVSVKRDSTEKDMLTVKVLVWSKSYHFPLTDRIDSSRAFDLHLLRDDRLVGEYPNSTVTENSDNSIDGWRKTNEIKLNGGDSTLITFKVSIPNIKLKDTIHFFAYAYNIDRVKSNNCYFDYIIDEKTISQKPTLFLLSIGVSNNEDKRYLLDYAAEDAKTAINIMANSFDKNNYSEIVRVPLLTHALGNPFEKHANELLPTKINIKCAFDILSGKSKFNADSSNVLWNKLKQAKPDDLVMLFFSCHGIDTLNNFYLLPYDFGNDDNNISAKEKFSRAIGSEELAQWMRGIDANQVAIIDACHSSQLVNGGNFKPAPLGERGFGQLAYDKGMSVLVAAENYARGDAQIAASYLAEALFREAMHGKKMNLRDAMLYVIKRIPELQKENNIETDKIQRPLFFDFNVNY